MQRIINYWYHGLLRNAGGAEGSVIEPVNEAQVAITRGSVVVALQAIVAGFVLLSTLSEAKQLILMSMLTPTITIAGFVLYGQLDRWLLQTPRRQRE